MLLSILKYPLAITGAAILLTLVFGGPQLALIVAILTILEVSLSFDNAVVNAKVLKRMSPFWQKIFLTVGIAIAVFGMRLVFPIIVVAVAASLGPLAVLTMALQDPGQYAHHLHEAHGAIAGFGGLFLLMLFLDWLFEKRDVKWFKPLEGYTSSVAPGLPMVIGLLTILVLTIVYGNYMIVAAGAGFLTYRALSWLSNRFEGSEDVVGAVGKAGFFSFLYLEVLDASFSFDGVIGAFAISNQVFVIALGLGLGALFVRSLTVYLVRAGKLAEYRYLEHGAHYAIGALAVILLVSVAHELPEVVTGLIGVGFILAAFVHSILKNREDQWLQEHLKKSAS